MLQAVENFICYSSIELLLGENLGIFLVIVEILVHFVREVHVSLPRCIGFNYVIHTKKGVYGKHTSLNQHDS